MHLLFVHKSYPAQFGGLAEHLAELGHRCTFVSTMAPREASAVERVVYPAPNKPGAGRFRQALLHAKAVRDALAQADVDEPDVIVGHSGFGSTFFLHELYPRTPIVNYFDFYVDPRGDSPAGRAANAMVLLDLETCAAGYTPTTFQLGLLPRSYHTKVAVVPDPIDTDLWRRRRVPQRAAGRLRVGDTPIAPETRIVTYVSRGLEPLRGFDVFVELARRICDRRDDVVFLVAGEDRVAYGDEVGFKASVLAPGGHDPDRIFFLGRVSEERLATIFSVSDLHVYLTHPYVASWSLLNAMACECVVLASRNEPVTELVEDARTGILRDLGDVDGLTEAALEVLDDPSSFRLLAESARRSVVERNAFEVVAPRVIELYTSALDEAAVPAR